MVKIYGCDKNDNTTIVCEMEAIVGEGGPGSGNFGHKGRPGIRGGSGGKKSNSKGGGSFSGTGTSNPKNDPKNVKKKKPPIKTFKNGGGGKVPTEPKELGAHREIEKILGVRKDYGYDRALKSREWSDKDIKDLREYSNKLADKDGNISKENLQKLEKHIVDKSNNIYNKLGFGGDRFHTKTDEKKLIAKQNKEELSRINKKKTVKGGSTVEESKARDAEKHKSRNDDNVGMNPSYMKKKKAEGEKLRSKTYVKDDIKNNKDNKKHLEERIEHFKEEKSHYSKLMKNYPNDKSIAKNYENASNALNEYKKASKSANSGKTTSKTNTKTKTKSDSGKSTNKSKNKPTLNQMLDDVDGYSLGDAKKYLSDSGYKKFKAEKDAKALSDKNIKSKGKKAVEVDSPKAKREKVEKSKPIENSLTKVINGSFETGEAIKNMSSEEIGKTLDGLRDGSKLSLKHRFPEDKFYYIDDYVKRKDKWLKGDYDQNQTFDNKGMAKELRKLVVEDITDDRISSFKISGFNKED